MNKFEERQCISLENNGQKIFGILHTPINRKKTPFPCVLICHGLAGNKSGKFRIYVSLAERLAQEGIATLRIDFRGSGDSEGSFTDVTIESEVSDTLKGIEFLTTFKGIDPERLGLLGNSFGAAIAVLAASKCKKIRSIVLLAALFSSHQWKHKWDLLNKESSIEEARKELMHIFHGNIPGTQFFPEFFNLNIENDLEKLHAIPVLHIHSHHDERIQMSHAEEYMKCREQAKAETCHIRLNKSDHSFSDPEERKQVIEAVTNWFTKTL